MTTLLWHWLLWGYLTLAIGGSLLVVGAGLHATLMDQWEAYLARRLAPILAAERQQHAAELEARRAEHQESQEWLMEMHRFCLDQQTRRHRAEMDAAVAEAMTSRAPHPLKDVA